MSWSVEDLRDMSDDELIRGTHGWPRIRRPSA